MQYRHLFPMVRILLPYMAGIVVCISFDADSGTPLIIWISLLLLSLCAALIPAKTKSFIKQWFFGLVVSLFFYVTGYNMVILHKEILWKSHFYSLQKQGTFIAAVIEPVQEKEHSFKTILQVKKIWKNNSLIDVDGRILTYLAKDSTNTPPVEGSIIVFSGLVQEIGPPANPGAFDYRKYMATNNVYHQIYINNFSWKTLKKPEGFNLYRTAHRISKKFVDILNHNGLKGQEFAVAAALLLGQNDMLDNETRQAYSGSGVTHILSVSGLHVGVIFIIINFLLGFMRKKGGQLYLKTVLILLTIWAYALLTGMSPPVMRSAAMFTFISIGNASKRYVHIINSLAVSAFILLIIDPLMISNIGFQLSYMAIVGIVFINKPIADLFNPKNKIAGQIWGLIAVSLAAQIATVPLTTLYFHQFPAYFIPANLVAIPLSFLAIYSGVSVLVTSAVPAISNFLGMLTNYLLFVLNYSVGFIENLPHSVLSITSVFTKEMILLYLVIIAVLMAVYYQKKLWIFTSLGLILLLSLSVSLTKISRLKQNKIIFYSTNRQTAIGFISGEHEDLIGDSLLLNDPKAGKFQLNGAETLFGVTTVEKIALDTLENHTQHNHENAKSLYYQGHNLLFQTRRIAIIDSIPKLRGNYSKLKVDYLVISRNPKLLISDLLQLYEPGLIIIDGSNSVYKTDKWMEACKKAGLAAYSIKNQGAYVVDL